MELHEERSDYEVGEYGLAVGTSIAFEELTAPENKKKVSKFNSLWVNIDTIIRNVHGALRPELRNAETIADYTMQDLEALPSAVDEALPKSDVVIYRSSAKLVVALVPKATVKIPKTDKQLEYIKLVNKVVGILQDKGIVINVLERKQFVGYGHQSVVLLSHYPIDLLLKYNFTELTLLESHTGKVRKSGEWVNKIVTSATKEYASYLPFNAISLAILGDGGKQLQPCPLPVRRAYLELAKTKRWKVTTTRDKIMHDVKSIDDKQMQEDIMSYIR